MRCPSCSHEQSTVVDSRSKEESAAIYRRRKCKYCGSRFTTHERVQLRDLAVVKSTGEHEPFDREKLFHSMKVALRKRPVDEDRIQRSANTIQRILERTPANEVPAETIGEMAMERLAELDKVAYVRFASVYKDFSETEDFERFLGELRPRQPNFR